MDDKLPPFLRPHADGTFLHVKVQPRASKNAIGPVMENELKISVTAPPVDAAANQATVELLAEHLACPKRNVEIRKGQTSRHKIIFIHGAAARDLARKLTDG